MDKRHEPTDPADLLLAAHQLHVGRRGQPLVAPLAAPRAQLVTRTRRHQQAHPAATCGRGRAGQKTYLRGGQRIVNGGLHC